MTKRGVLTAAAVLATAVVARLAWLHGEFNVSEPDEVMYLHVAENFSRGVPYPRYDYETRYADGLFVVPPMPLYLAGLVFQATGPSLLAFRAMSASFGVASVAAFAAFAGLYLSGVPLVVAVLLFALSPLALHESTQAMLGAPAVFFLLVSLWAYVKHARAGRRLHLVLFAVSLGATAACKQYGLLVGGLLLLHWAWLRWRTGGPSLRRLLVAYALAVGTFGLLVPWVFWRPYDSMRLYLYQSLILHVMLFLRGQRGRGTLFALPYPELVFAQGLVGALGLVAFMATWRRKGDVAAWYGALLGLPIIAVREVRYLSLALPIWCLFAGHLLATVAEAARRSRLARGIHVALVLLLVGSLAPASLVPWRPPPGLAEACRFVANHTSPDEQVTANYWRPVIERFTRRTMPCDWLDAQARQLIERGEVVCVILDDSTYTRRVLHSRERAATAAWVRETFPVVWALDRGGRGGVRVYWTKGGVGGGD